MEEGAGDAVAELSHHVLKGGGGAHRFRHDATQLGVNRRVALRLEVHAPAVLPSAQEAARRERAEFPLQARRPRVQVFSEFAQIPPPVRLPVRGRENIAPRPGEQGIDRSFLTHNA